MHYRTPSIPRFVIRRYRSTGDFQKAVVMAGIYTTARIGFAGRVSGDLPRLLGREPRDFETFVRDHTNEWH